MKKLIALVLSILTVPATAMAAWTPLLQSTDFDGLKGDILTAVGGLMAVVLVVLGVGIIVRMLTRT